MGEKDLKKENQNLRNELGLLKSGFKVQDASWARDPAVDLPQVESSIQFTSGKYDALLKFVKDAQGQLISLFSRIVAVFEKRDEISVFVDSMGLISAWDRQGSRSRPLFNVLQGIFT